MACIGIGLVLSGTAVGAAAALGGASQTVVVREARARSPSNIR